MSIHAGRGGSWLAGDSGDRDLALPFHLFQNYTLGAATTRHALALLKEAPAHWPVISLVAWNKGTE